MWEDLLGSVAAAQLVGIVAVISKGIKQRGERREVSEKGEERIWLVGAQVVSLSRSGEGLSRANDSRG